MCEIWGRGEEAYAGGSPRSARDAHSARNARNAHSPTAHAEAPGGADPGAPGNN